MLAPLNEDEKHIASLKQRMSDILHSTTLADYEKVALYEDAMARLRGFLESIDVPPTVRIEQPPSNDVVPAYKLPTKDKNFWKIFEGIRTNDRQEIVLDGRVIERSNINTNLDYAMYKTDFMPYGYEEFYNHVRSKVNYDIQPIAEKEEKPIKLEMLAESEHDENENYDTASDKSADQWTPVVSRSARRKMAETNASADRVYGVPAPAPMSRRTRQQGTGRRRLYIKLWTL